MVANAWLERRELSPDEGWLMGIIKGSNPGIDGLLTVDDNETGGRTGNGTGTI